MDDDSKRVCEQPELAASTGEVITSSNASRVEPFFTGSPQQLLKQFFTGDPLGIQARCLARITAEAVMICENRLYLRAVARAAHDGPRYTGEPILAHWLDERVGRAIHELLEVDRQLDRRNGEIVDERHYRLFIDLLQVSPEVSRAMFVAFNDLPFEVRRAYLRFAKEELGAYELSQELGLTKAEFRGYVLRAMRTVLALKGEDR